jgi:isopentenyl-diphosphate delta-isomerase
MLIQRRASSKYHFAGKWSNAACTHPLWLETPLEAGRRALQNELGIDAVLTEVARFTYSAYDPVSGYTEREYDHILIGVWSGDPRPTPDEVDELSWVMGTELRVRMADHEGQFTFWFREIIKELIVRPTSQIGVPEELNRFLESFCHAKFLTES